MSGNADTRRKPKPKSTALIVDQPERTSDLSRKQANLCAECRQIPQILRSMNGLPTRGSQDPVPPLLVHSNFRANRIAHNQQSELTNRPRNVSQDADEWEGRARSVTILIVAGSLCPSCVFISKTLLAHGLLEETTQVHLSAVCLANRLYTLATTLKGVTVHMSLDSVLPSYIESYSPSGIPTSFAKDCLRHCVRAHAGVCAKLRDISSAIGALPICLIDLESKSLVFASSQSVYVALSYVWGSPNISPQYSVLECSTKNLSKMLQKGFFKFDEFRFPPTILDAMRFTKLMGVRYLWVDRYCIVQDDDQDKHNQLRAMGSIYYNAHFTIIAAEGDVTYGLRGFNDSPETWKLRNCPGLCSELETNVGITYDPVTENTLWSTRGWTFQEQVFSRRSFIFRGEIIIFKCWKSIWQEGTAVPISYDNSLYALGETKLTIYKWPNILYFRGLLEGFALRELTYPCDSLDALTGVLSVLEASFPGGFLFGLPEVCFDIALLWQSRGILVDRVWLAETECKPIQNLPSWSWARWKGPLDFTAWEAAAECLFLSFYNQNFCVVKKIVEWQKQSQTLATAVPVADCYSSSRDLALDDSLPSPAGWKRAPLRRDVGQGSALRHRLGSAKYKFTHESLGNDTLFRFPIPLSTGVTAVRDDQPWSHYIQGRVKSTFLFVMLSEKVQEEGDCWSAVMGKPTYCEKDCQVGVVRVHDRKLESWSGGNFLGEFIAISAGEFVAAPGDRVGIPWTSFDEWETNKRSDDGNIYRFYNVMLIRRRNGIAERRGLGRVEKSLWESMALEEVEITLG